MAIKRNGILIHATTRMTLENMLSERSHQGHRACDSTYMQYLEQATRRNTDQRLPGAGAGRNGECLLAGSELPFGVMKSFGKTVVMVVPHRECNECHWIVCLKMAKIANFILYIFYQNENPHIHSWPHIDLVNSPPSLGPQGRLKGPGKLEAHPCPAWAEQARRAPTSGRRPGTWW